MSNISVNDKGLSAPERAEIVKVCPFGALSDGSGALKIDSGCRMCRMCVKKYPEVFTFHEDKIEEIDKSLWQGVAVAAETDAAGVLHPVSLELLGKARELAAKIGQQVYVFVAGRDNSGAINTLLKYGADLVVSYQHDELEHFRAVVYTAALEDFINYLHPAVVLVGGTPMGRTLAPRAAARFRTGLTADCTVIDIKENTDLEQIRPAFGGNIMAHINTPNHRPQFATVRYKILPLPEMVEKVSGRVVERTLPPENFISALSVTGVEPLPPVKGIEEAEVIVAAGKGVRRKEDLAMLEELAAALHGEMAGTRPLIEENWLDHKRQIGLSGRTVAPKLIICCGISGSVQFAAGMKGAAKIIAINNDPGAAIFNIAHVGIVGDLYAVIPELLEKIRRKGTI